MPGQGKRCLCVRRSDLDWPTVTAAVVLDRLGRRFGAVVACDEMTWSAPTGAITAILGPNGAGKTTALECAVGLQRPDSGTVRVLGADPWLSAPEHRARVGVMLQTGGLPNGTKPMRLLHHLARFYAEPADVATCSLTASASTGSPGRPCGASPGARSSASRRRPRWWGAPRWSSSTSRRRAWTRTAGSTSTTCCARSETTASPSS